MWPADRLVWPGPEPRTWLADQLVRSGPGRGHGRPSSRGRLIPTVVLSTRPYSARVSADPAAALSCNAHLMDPTHLSRSLYRRRRISPPAKSEPRAPWPRLVELAVCRVKLPRSFFPWSPDRIGSAKSPIRRKGLRPHSASSLAIFHGRDSHRAASAPMRAPRMRSFCRYKCGCFTRNEYSFTAGLSCRLWPTGEDIA